MRERNAFLVRLLAFAAGLVYITVIYEFPIFASYHGLSGLFLLSFVVLGSITFVLVVRAGKGSSIAVPLLILIGVVVGTMADVVLDTKEDRNLFPIEIMLNCAFLAPILLTSSALGWFVKNRSSKAR